jgi:hypothetical protein
MPDFIPGLELSRLFFNELVKPLLETEFPALHYDAAMIGPGSEVLGFDTVQSTDHDWGPRVGLIVSETDYPQYASTIHEMLRHRLPHQFRGYPTGYSRHEDGSMMMTASNEGPVEHRVTVSTVREMLRTYLAYDWQLGEAIASQDWLTFPEQKLRTLTAGAVYHEGLGDLAQMRADLRYYPRDVWLYRLACGWRRVDQEEPFMGRCGDVGDDLGSRIIAGRLVRDLMRLCFLMERVYAPYPKWFGTGFFRLECAATLTPIFERVLAASDWKERERHLSEAYRILAELHNALGITERMPTEVSPFYERPYLVLHSGTFVEAIRAMIEDEVVKGIAERTLIGGIDQFSDSTDMHEQVGLRRQLATLYE